VTRLDCAGAIKGKNKKRNSKTLRMYNRSIDKIKNLTTKSKLELLKYKFKQ